MFDRGESPISPVVTLPAWQTSRDGQSLKISHAWGGREQKRKGRKCSQIISRQMVDSTIWRKVLDVHSRVASRVTRVRTSCLSLPALIRARC